MKKILAIILCFLMLFMAGCSKESESDFETEEKNTYFIPLDSQNFFTLNYKDLSKKISSNISKIRGANGNNIYGSFKLYIYLKPNGQIIKFRGTLPAEEFHDETSHQMARYFIDNKYIKSEENFFGIRDTLKTDKSPMAGIEISGGRKDRIFKNHPGYDGRNLDIYPKFVNWFDNFDFKNILDEYVEKKPVFYMFITNDNLFKLDIMEDPSINITFLDCSSEKITELKDKDIRSNISSDECLNFSDRQFFCAILPYYLQDGTIKGYRESSFGDYQREDEEVVPSYVAKNIIVIFNDNIK